MTGAFDDEDTSPLETFRRLTAAGYEHSAEQYRPDLAPSPYGPEYFGGCEYYGGEEFGGLFSGLKKAVSGAVKGVAKGVTSVGRTALAPARAARDIASGKNVYRSVRDQAAGVVRDVRSALPAAASAISVVPGLGTVAASGISAVSAISRGKSLREIAEDAAMGAVPGGQAVKSALRVGINAARGQNLLKSAAREGASFAQRAIPIPQSRAFSIARQIARR